MIATQAAPAATVNTSFQPITDNEGERIVIYGPGGIGKSSLALMAPGTQGWLDGDRSLGKLKRSTDTSRVKGVLPFSNFTELYGHLTNYKAWEGIDYLVLDSFTVAEELAEADVIAKHKTRAGQPAKSIVDYGYGDGFRLLYDRDDLILQAADVHARAGRNVIIVCHEGTMKKKNAMGEDYAKLCPNVLETNQYSFATRLNDWADHVLYIGYDTAVSNGKAQGSGSRSIYVQGSPMMLAKSRTVKTKDGTLDYEEGSDALWQLMFPPEPNPAKKEDSK